MERPGFYQDMTEDQFMDHMKKELQHELHVAKLSIMKGDATFSLHALFYRDGEEDEDEDHVIFARGCLRGLTYPWEEPDAAEATRLDRLLAEMD